MEWLFVVVERDGQPRLARRLYTARFPKLLLHPAGRVVVGETTGTPQCRRAQVVEYDLEGRILWANTIGSAECKASVEVWAIAYSGDEIAVGGSFEGTMDFAGAGAVSSESGNGWLLMLRRPH
ncbi:MAG: hypothetical protein ACYC8T_16110 [Myxococcaceae bacterium]